MPDHQDDAAEKSSNSSDTPETTDQDRDKRQTDRRKFIQTAALGAVGLTTGALDPIKAMAGARASNEAPASRPSSLETKFDHVVVLMMENRSFDHMLGRLYYSENSPPFDKPPRGQKFDGIQPSMSNPVSSAYSWLPAKVGVNRATHYATPPDDNVGHQYPDAVMQIGVKGVSGSAMNGFVNDRVLNLGVSKKPPLSEVEAPMLGFSPAEYIANGKGPFAAASVLSTLANSFAVCDNWFSSLPGPTLVNRSFLHAGTSNNWVSNNHNWDQNQNPTVFNLLGRRTVEGLQRRWHHRVPDLHHSSHHSMATRQLDRKILPRCIARRASQVFLHRARSHRLRQWKSAGRPASSSRYPPRRKPDHHDLPGCSQQSPLATHLDDRDL